MARIALFQSNSGIDPAANGRRLVQAIDRAAEGGATMLFTPEMSNLLDGDRKRAALSIVDEKDDTVLAAVREAAAKAGIWVHLGSMAFKGEGDRFVNRAIVIDDGGEIRGRYDKIHLFDVDLPTGETWRESKTYERGERAVVVKGTPVGDLGLTICYDIRFPALFAKLAEANAKTIAVPAAFTVPTGKAHWHVLLRARAIEAGLFVVAAAQVAKHEDGRETFGHSLVVDPWGEVIFDRGEEPGVGFCEVNLDRVEEVRSRVPALSHRRVIPEVDC